MHPSAGDLGLDDKDRSMLAGELGPGRKLAMDLLVTLARATGATRFVDITAAHIDGCLYHGQAGSDFARALLEGGASVSVPTTLNVSSLDLLHPELYRGSRQTAIAAKDLMDLHVELGCRPTWTCAPYQLASRPRFGDQIAWGESNAIVFSNSVIGARTNRYGDFADLACAIAGRAPLSGLHTDNGRRATVVVELDLSEWLMSSELLFPLLGLWIGANCGTEVPLIVGLEREADEDSLKALGAAAASSGAVAMFHVLGVTPEAPTREQATGGREARRVTVRDVDLGDLRDHLVSSGPLGAVSIGTPHMSSVEMAHLVSRVRGQKSRVPFYVSTAREVLEDCDAGDIEALKRFGATVVTDTCTYITPIMEEVSGVVMTNSGKWAYYAPGNLGVDVSLGTLDDCVTSAVEGQLSLAGWQTP